MLSVSIALNALSTHATCTAVFVAVAAIIAFIFSSIQTLGRITWLAWVGVTAIITASKYWRANHVCEDIADECQFSLLQSLSVCKVDQKAPHSRQDRGTRITSYSPVHRSRMLYRPAHLLCLRSLEHQAISTSYLRCVTLEGTPDQF